HAGVEKDLTPELKASPIVLTNLARLHGPNVADQGMALLLALTRGLGPRINRPAFDPRSGTGDGPGLWNALKAEVKPQELHGKTMLVVGLGGIGTQVARRAHAFGMRVLAVDPNEAIERPSFVFSLDRPAKLMQLLPQANVVLLACPLTEQTRGMIGASQLQAMKKTAYL